MKRNTLATLQTALSHQNSRRFEEAESLYRAVLEAEPANTDALNLLGVLEHQRGRHQEAVEWISKAIQISPKNPDFHNNLGLVMVALGKLAEAVPCFKTTVRLRPDFQDAHYNLGVVLQNLDQMEEAVAAYEKALALKREPGTLNNLGVAYLKGRHFGRAIRCFDEALRIKPLFADALFNLAGALQDSGQAQASIPYYEKRARLPDPPPALALQLAKALHQCGRAAEAETWYRQALKTQPAPSVCLNLAAILEQRFDFAGAESMLRQALGMQPDYPEAMNNLGNILLATRRPEEALLAYDQAIQLKADYVEAHYNRSQARLTLGDFAGGWADYDYRWLWKGFPHQRPRFPQPEWTGDDLNGRTLLVHNEQGLGDTIQFGRYLSVIAARGGKVLFACPKELKSLFSATFGVFSIVDSNQPILKFDVHAPLMSLPRLCGTRLDSIPNQVPYLPLPPAEQFPLPPSTRGRLRVGIVWAGGDRHPKDKLRSLSLSQFVPLLRHASCEFFSLQTPPRGAELASLPEGLKVEDLGSRLGDFAETAAVLGQLDLIISADTAVLHLAGALARPVWGLLPFAPDWRWMLEREDSPWYPTMRLFRQSVPGDWSGVITRVQQELDRVVLDTLARSGLC